MKALREGFAANMGQLDPENLVFLDEFGANLAMVPRYGWAPAGERVHINKPSKRGRNVTFAGALSLGGILGLVALPGSATVVNFVEWVRSSLVPSLRPRHVVVMDNLTAHHNAAVASLIEGAGARILFLPPYSPDLNPIEECWSKIKTFLRKARARSEDALVTAVDMASEMVTSADARGWFRHAGYRVHQPA